jgi:hypothetical protein
LGIRQIFGKKNFECQEEKDVYLARIMQLSEYFLIKVIPSRYWSLNLFTNPKSDSVSRKGSEKDLLGRQPSVNIDLNKEISKTHPEEVEKIKRYFSKLKDKKNSETEVKKIEKMVSILKRVFESDITVELIEKCICEKQNLVKRISYVSENLLSFSLGASKS